MKILIVFISLILTINCQNSGFRFFFDGNRLLGNGNNGGLNSNLNGGFNSNLNGLNNNLNGGFNNNLNGLNLNNNDANLNLMNDDKLNKLNNMMDVLVRFKQDNNQNFNNFLLTNNNLNKPNLDGELSGLSNQFRNKREFNLNNDQYKFSIIGSHLADRMGTMSMILGGNQQFQPQQLQPQQSQPQQSQPQQSQQQQSQFQQQSASFTDRLNYAPPNSPALQVPISSAFNTPTVSDYKNEITAGPILAPGLLAPLPRVPDLPAAPAPNTFGLTNLGKQIAPQTFNPNGNLPPAPPQNNNSNNNSANLPSVPSLPQLNNNNLGNGLNNFNNGLNNGAYLSGNQFQNDLASSANRELPIEISQFSTRIVHDSPARSSPLLSNLGRLNGLRS